MNNYRVKNLDKVREHSRNSYYKIPEIRIQKTRERYQAMRKAAISFYSDGKNCCECCGEKEYKFLAIDHIDLRYGTGKDHRKKNGASLCNWMLANDFPEGFRILCHNCNLGRNLNGGTCPHKSKQS